MALLEYGLPGYLSLFFIGLWFLGIIALGVLSIHRPQSIHRKMDLRNNLNDQVLVGTVLSFVAMWIARSFC